ncbi:MAG: hypothetical protein M1834_008880 [Cirrosporium novae-zelandiae]|nr:MAG: hypothetical protein M1834_008880 [Cirrosporium novae-zelandiae]
MCDSPQKDMGYDISNSEDIYPQYGTLTDAENLIKECHMHGMKYIFGLFINHISDQYAWFKESRSSKDNPNKTSIFGGLQNMMRMGNGCHQPEYYLHPFTLEQPDLNWETEDTRDAIYRSAVQFWLDKGIDGFRIDTVNILNKGNELPDGPINNPRDEF